MDGSYVIRAVKEADVPGIGAIYGAEVLHGVATWEYEPPTETELLQRMRNIVDAGYPYFVCEKDGRVVGYAYASSFRPRAGYRFTVENSVYVHPNVHRKGVARALMTTLMGACVSKGYTQMVAVIGDSENRASIELHRSLGFVDAGVLKGIGVKHGRTLDCVFMQKRLGAGA